MAMSQERKGTIAVSLTNFLDSGCIVASSVALTAWAAAFGFGSMWTSILGAIGANAFGAAIGALIGGFLTDKYGRTIIYRYNLLVYAIGVAIAMCAMNLPMVVVGVVLSGLSVGAGVPASWSYISETSTSTKRAANIGISQFAWSCGPAIIFLLSLALSFALSRFRGANDLLHFFHGTVCRILQYGKNKIGQFSFRADILPEFLCEFDTMHLFFHPCT